MKLRNLLFTVTMIPFLAFATEKKPDLEEFKKQITDILNSKEVLLIKDEKEYIYNLNTTPFIKGLFVQTTYLFKYISENSEDEEKLLIAQEDLAFNTLCLQASIKQEAIPHIEALHALSLPTEELKAKFKKGALFIMDKNQVINADPMIIDLCRNEGVKAAVYQDKQKNKKTN